MNHLISHRTATQMIRTLHLLIIFTMTANMLLPAMARAAPIAPASKQIQPTLPTSTETGPDLAEPASTMTGGATQHLSPPSLLTTLAITTTYLPIIMSTGSDAPPSQPLPPPPEGQEVLVQPGIGAIVGPADDTINITVSREAVQEDTWLRYQELARPDIITPNLAVAGPAFVLTAWHADDNAPVNTFPHQVTVITNTSPWYSIFTPSLTIELTYTVTDTWGLDLSVLALYQKDDASGDWLKIPTAVYPAQQKLVAHVDTLGEFVPLSRLASDAPGDSLSPSARSADVSAQNSAPTISKLVIDPDDQVGWAYWPGQGTQREITYNLKLAKETRARLEQDKCKVDILLTRESEIPSVDRPIRAQMARNFGGEMFVTFAFNALEGSPWGSSIDGGSLVWSGGEANDVALGNELLNQIGVLGRPKKWGSGHPYLPYSEFVALNAPYAHIETLYLDHNFDWPIINSGFDAIADATYTAVRAQLEDQYEMQCGDDPNKPPPYPTPPSAAQLKQWQDLGYQNMQQFGTQYELLYLRRHYQALDGDPISMSTGNFVQQVHLARLPGRGGLDVDLTLTYNAQDNRNDLLGYGWSFPYNIRLQQYEGGSVSLTLHDGRSYYYPWNGSSYETPPGVHETLTKIADGWQWQTIDGMVLIFREVIGSQGSGLGVMSEWRDRQGNALTFEYDLSQQDNWQDGNDVPRPPLTKIIDTAGRSINLTSNADSHITALTLPDGRTFKFGYDGNGNLTEMTDAKNQTRRFEYDARHRVIKEWDAANILFLQNRYDDRNRVISQVDASGTTSTFSYDPLQGQTTFIDNLGNATHYFYDAQNRITAIEDAQGHTSHYEYGPKHDIPLKITDPRGFETTRAYDDNGNLTQRSDPIDGYSAAYYGSDTTTFEYNAANDLIKTIDALGNVTTFEYDANGNLTAIRQPDGRNTSFAYNGWGQPLSMTDPNGHTTTYDYDSAGNLLKTTDAAGHTSTSTYDAVGRELSYTDANGHTVAFAYDNNNNITQITDPKGKVTLFEYDANDLLTKATDRRGGVTTYAYDENLKLIKETDPAGFSVAYAYDLMYNRIEMIDQRGQVTRYQYDTLYRLNKLIDANNHETHYNYDANGNLIAVTDSLGHTSRLTYDGVNRLKFLTDPLSQQTEYCYDAEDRLIRLFNPRRALTRYEYDEVDNLVRLIDPMGEVTTFEYDPASNLRFVTDANNHTNEYVYDRINRLVRQLDPLGHETATGYDAVGNVIDLTDPRGNITRFNYDANDNLTTITDALNNVISYSYDDEDNQIGVIDPRGNSTSLAYDLRGLVISVTEPGNFTTDFAYDGSANLIELTNAKGQVTTYSYDPVDRLSQEIDALNQVTTYNYDAADRLTSIVDAEGNPTFYGYDAADQLVSVTDALNHSTRYGYDEVGNLTVITDANQIATHFEYSFRDELVKEINPLTNTWEYHYDGVGNLITRRDANWQPTHYEYDAANRLAKIRYPSAIGSSGTDIDFAYDAAGNEVAMTDWNGTISHQYDALNRRTQTTNFDGQVLQYSYDAASNLTGLTYPNGQAVAYAYDARNLLSSLIDPDNRTTSYNHDALGALTQIIRPNSTSTSYDYDGVNRLIEIDHQQGDTTFSAFAYALDKVGNRTQISELRTFMDSGAPVPVTTVKSYNYDAIYRLTNAATDQGQATAYAFDSVGNRTTQSGIPQAVDPSDSLQPLRPAAPIANQYSYNAANQLTTINRQSSIVNLDYDSKGNRLAETEVLTNGTTLLTNYTWDHENRLVGVTQSVSDTTAVTVTMVATYTYDGYGRRVEKEVTNLQSPNLLISYLYHGLDPLADTETHIISGTSVSTTTHYYWANGGIAEIERLPNPTTGFPGDVHWTHTDGLGSLTDLTDLSGTPAFQVYFDEYGILQTKFEAITRYSYTGQEYDVETGLYHFYARYYDPTNGVWLSQDPYRGEIVNPLSLHRYGYVGGNPIGYVDKYGFIGVLGVVAVVTIGYVGFLGIIPGVTEVGKHYLTDEPCREGSAVGAFVRGAWEGLKSPFTSPLEAATNVAPEPIGTISDLINIMPDQEAVTDENGNVRCEDTTWYCDDMRGGFIPEIIPNIYGSLGWCEE